MTHTEEHRPVEYADQLTYALTHITEFQNLIRFADAKAGAAITLVSGLLAVLLPDFNAILSALSQHPATWQFWVAVLALALSTGFFVTLVGVLSYAFLTFLPRLEKRESTPTIAFFLDCYNMGEQTFINNVRGMSTENLVEHMLREVYLLSEILVAKFRTQHLCFMWLRFVLGFWATAQISILLLP